MQLIKFTYNKIHFHKNILPRPRTRTMLLRWDPTPPTGPVHFLSGPYIANTGRHFSLPLGLSIFRGSYWLWAFFLSLAFGRESHGNVYGKLQKHFHGPFLNCDATCRCIRSLCRNHEIWSRSKLTASSCWTINFDNNILVWHKNISCHDTFVSALFPSEPWNMIPHGLGSS